MWTPLIAKRTLPTGAGVVLAMMFSSVVGSLESEMVMPSVRLVNPATGWFVTALISVNAVTCGPDEDCDTARYVALTEVAAAGIVSTVEVDEGDCRYCVAPVQPANTCPRGAATAVMVTFVAAS